MPFSFRRVFRIGPLRFGVGKRGISSVGIGRATKSRGRTARVSLKTGIPGLTFHVGGKRRRR
jgi:hypothetical protein